MLEMFFDIEEYPKWRDFSECIELFKRIELLVLVLLLWIVNVL